LNRTWTPSSIQFHVITDAADGHGDRPGYASTVGWHRGAGGRVRQFDIFAAEVAWGGTWRAVLVSAVGKEPLLGMRLMAGHKLLIDVVPGGLVEIIPLP
jgi:hypothetical protein